MVDMEHKPAGKLWKWWILVALGAVVCLGFFLRSYHFGEWLHFELDQARDARVIDAALEGSAADLPLLGPKAAGTFLRLGPFFYIFQYVSGLIFGANPVGYALGVMVLSVASIGVFFFLVRRFFTDHLALGLSAIFSVSLFFVLYGRFAWNPNPLPFFILSGLYAILRSVDTHESRRGVWFVVAVTAFALASQLHFLAFLSLPVLLGSFLLLRRPRYSWKAWCMALGIVMLLYFPVVLNDIETGGKNVEQFLLAITKKSSQEDHSILEKLMRDVSEHGLASLVIVTGFEGGTFPTFRWENGVLASICLDRCDEGKWYGLAALCILALGLSAFVSLWWKERERTKADFLLLTGLWFVVTFTLFLPLSYNIAPRFFLLSGPFFLIVLGALLLVIERTFSRHRLGAMLSGGVILLLIGLNVFFVGQRFEELADAGTRVVVSAPDRVLKERIRVTMEQQIAIVEFLEARSLETGFPIYMGSEPQHRRALKYLLERRGFPSFALGLSGIYRQSVSFLILRTQSDHEDALEKYRAAYTVGPATSFGTLIVFELFPKPEAIEGEREVVTAGGSDSLAPPRYTWREWFMRQGWGPEAKRPGDILDESDESDEMDSGA